MKRYNWLIPISMTMMVLACDPSKEDPKPDTSIGGDVASDIATDTNSSPDVGIDLTTDTGASDSGVSNIGLDVGSGDIGLIVGDDCYTVADDLSQRCVHVYG